MAATGMASSSLQIACRHTSSSPSEARLLLRHAISLSPCKHSALKLASNGTRLSMSAGPRSELSIAGPVALAVLAASIVPEMAEAVAPGVSPSLQNLLQSVIAGGVVLVGIGGVVAAVSTFDPVKRK